MQKSSTSSSVAEALDDEGLDGFAAVLVRDSDSYGLGHGFVFEEDLFDLTWVDAIA